MREMTRRDALGLVGLSALGTLLAACSSAPAAGTAAAPTTATGSAPTNAAPAAATSASAAASGNTTLKILMWQGPTILNVHLAQGTKDQIASRLMCEPLVTVAGDGTMSPVLAAEVPSQQNGGLSADGRTVTYKLKPNVKWADGQPLTADDVVFTYQYLSNPDTAAVTVGTYLDLESVDAVDPTTVKLTFKQPTGAWFNPFSGANGLIVPKHALQEYTGANARNAPFNLKPFGTGPFVVDDFKPGDTVTLSANPNYREPNKPFFKQITIKGGGDAVSAARAVFETGDYDYAWNLQVEIAVLNEVQKGGKGDLVTAPGAGVEQMYFNFADPNSPDEKSSPNSKHPFLTDPRVRQAMAMAIDRATIAQQLYGPTGDMTVNVLTTPTNLNSKNTSVPFDVDKANQLLDSAGYARGSDGIRVTPSGVPLKVVYATSINSLRQKEQALIKDGWNKIGIDSELKTVDASVYFGNDPGNPDTYAHFNCDVQMFTSTFDSPSPVLYMKRFYAEDLSRDWAQQTNQWAPQNFLKWSSDDFNKLYDQARVETDATRASQMWIQLNDMVVNAYAASGIIDRKFTDGKSKSITGPNPSPFDSVFAWNIADWTRA